mmetsp:Transcript_2585/g.5036  ORF Transcript_2585/g.5036 Transcript_2585/m.5036 type:complete len:220 (+) Transcript_2585:408-1067(+)
MCGPWRRRASSACLVQGGGLKSCCESATGASTTCAHNSSGARPLRTTRRGGGANRSSGRLPAASLSLRWCRGWTPSFSSSTEDSREGASSSFATASSCGLSDSDSSGSASFATARCRRSAAHDRRSTTARSSSTRAAALRQQSCTAPSGSSALSAPGMYHGREATGGGRLSVRAVSVVPSCSPRRAVSRVFTTTRSAQCMTRSSSGASRGTGPLSLARS